MKQRILLHLTAFVVLLPCMLTFNISGRLWINLLGIVYCGCLSVILTENGRAKRFLRRYYHEILRLENMM